MCCCIFLMPRPLKWCILGASSIILYKNIHNYSLGMCGSNFYETDVTSIVIFDWIWKRRLQSTVHPVRKWIYIWHKLPRTFDFSSSIFCWLGSPWNTKDMRVTFWNTIRNEWMNFKCVNKTFFHLFENPPASTCTYLGLLTYPN